MKIKTDFVTNSSSTAYVVYIPKKFIITEDEMLNLMYLDELDVFKDEEDETKRTQMIVQLGFQILEELKNGKNFHGMDYDEDDNRDKFNIAHSICSKYNFILDDIETGGGDGNDVIIAVTREQLDKIEKKM